MPDIEIIPVENSSNVAGYGYDLPTNTLAMQFRDKEGNPGPKYFYSEVPMEVYAGMTSAESVGKFFYANVKGKYTCQKEGE